MSRQYDFTRIGLLCGLCLSGCMESEPTNTVEPQGAPDAVDQDSKVVPPQDSQKGSPQNALPDASLDAEYIFLLSKDLVPEDVGDLSLIEAEGMADLAITSDVEIELVVASLNPEGKIEMSSLDSSDLLEKDFRAQQIGKKLQLRYNTPRFNALMIIGIRLKHQDGQIEVARQKDMSSSKVVDLQNAEEIASEVIQFSTLKISMNALSTSLSESLSGGVKQEETPEFIKLVWDVALENLPPVEAETLKALELIPDQSSFSTASTTEHKAASAIAAHVEKTLARIVTNTAVLHQKAESRNFPRSVKEELKKTAPVKTEMLRQSIQFVTQVASGRGNQAAVVAARTFESVITQVPDAPAEVSPAQQVATQTDIQDDSASVQISTKQGVADLVAVTSTTDSKLQATSTPTPPPTLNPAQAPSWQISSSNTTQLTARWTRSSSSHMTGQKIRLYELPESQVAVNFNTQTCSGVNPAGDWIEIDKFATQYTFSNLGEKNYVFSVLTLSSIHNQEATSHCSPYRLVDRTPPAPPSSPQWVGTSPQRGAVQLQWQKSPSADVISYGVEVFKTPGCTGTRYTVLSKIPMSGDTQSTSYAGGNQETIYFKVMAFDRAGLPSESSACSPTGMLFDNTLPNAASQLKWSGLSHVYAAGETEENTTRFYHNQNSLLATWTRSDSTDLASQTLELFKARDDDRPCYKIPGATHVTIQQIPLLPTDSNKQLIDLTFEGTAPPAPNNYSYRIISRDSAENETASACSKSVNLRPSTHIQPNSVWSLGTTATSPHPSETFTTQWSGYTNPTPMTMVKQQLTYYFGKTCDEVNRLETIELDATTRSHLYTASRGEGDYSATLTVINQIGNQWQHPCQHLVSIDLGAPNPATNLLWLGNITTTTNTFAALTWANQAGDAFSSEDKLHVLLYSGNACQGTPTQQQQLTSPTATQKFISDLSPNAVYTAKVRRTDVANRSVESACSPALQIDNTSPPAATSLVWQGQGDRTHIKTQSLTAQWSIADTSDVKNVRVDFYRGDFAHQCGLTAASSQNFLMSSDNLDKTATAYVLDNPSADGKYAFTVITEDAVGHITRSGCVSVILDRTDPPSAFGLSWNNVQSPTAGIVSNINSVTMHYILPTDDFLLADIYKQEIQLHEGPGCNSPLSEMKFLISHRGGSSVNPITNALLPSVPTDNDIPLSIFFPINDGIYSFTIIHTDQAGNSRSAPCSPSLEIDRMAPQISSFNEGNNVYQRQIENIQHESTWTVTAKWAGTAPLDTNTMTIVLYHATECDNPPVHSSVIDKTSTQFSFESPEKIMSFRLVLTDTAGNPNSFCHSRPQSDFL